MVTATTARPARTPPKSTAEPGVIHADRLYTRAALRRILGVSDYAIRKAKRRGLRPSREFGQELFFGGDVIAHCQQMADHETPAAS